MKPGGKTHILDYLLTEVRTTETSQLQVSCKPSRYTTRTPVEAIAERLRYRCHPLCPDDQSLQSVYAYARLLFRGDENQRAELLEVVRKAAENWSSMFERGTTLFLAGSIKLVVELLDQKAAL